MHCILIDDLWEFSKAHEMAIDLASNTEVVRDEIAWLERRLGELEDWRALGQLEAREARGEGVNAVDGQRLKSLLLQSLSDNPLFERYNFLLTQTGLAQDAELANPLAVHKSGAGPVAAPAASPDDLGRIRGISKVLARRLSGLGVASFAQIANWTSADVQHVARTLGISRQISSENWIEQAALLALGTESLRSKRDTAVDATDLIPVEVVPHSVASQNVVALLASAAKSAADEVLAVADRQVQPAAAPPEMMLTESPLPPAPLAAGRYANAESSAMTVADALAILGLFPLPNDDAIPSVFAEPETPFSEEPVVQEPVAQEAVAPELFAAEPVLPEPVTPEPVIPEPVTLEPSPPERPRFEAAAAAIEQPVVHGTPPLPLSAASYATGLAAKRRVERQHWMVDTASELRAIERLLAQPMPGQFNAQRSAPEAQVTIKRGPDLPPSVALKPAPVEVRAKRPPPVAAPDGFDGSNYAAYRDHIEEASVEIVKHCKSADTAQPPAPLAEPRLRSSAALELAAKSTLDWFVNALKRA